jgi:ATP-dependent DNA helicase RecQ
VSGSAGDDPLGESAATLFGVRYLFPQQRYIISNTLEARNQIAILPTGAGKSLCFQLPAQLLPGITLVLVPILSLLADQVRKLGERCIPVGVLRGGQDAPTRARLAREIREGSVRIVYATPEVLATRAARELLRGIRIANLVVDEAHCVCEWGESFRPVYLALGELVRDLAPDAVTALTATGSPAIVDRVREIVFAGRDVLVYISNPDRPNISYAVVPALSKEHTLTELVAAAARPLVVFGRSRKSVERYARVLRRRLAETEVRFYHAGLDRDERRAVEEWFLPSSRGILTATSAYGMGVDKPDVRTVVHVDVPPSPEAYLQESGRAGRDGASAGAILVRSAEDDRFADGLEDVVARRRYAQMLAYSLEQGRCRRESLLRFMGAEAVGCRSCDVCSGTAASVPAGEREIIEALARERRRFTPGEAVHFLAGARSAATLRRGLWRHAGFGVLAGWERDDVESSLAELAVRGDVVEIRRGPWKGKLTVPRRPEGRVATPSGTRMP